MLYLPLKGRYAIILIVLKYIFTCVCLYFSYYNVISDDGASALEKLNYTETAFEISVLNIVSALGYGFFIETLRLKKIALGGEIDYGLIMFSIIFYPIAFIFYSDNPNSGIEGFFNALVSTAIIQGFLFYFIVKNILKEQILVKSYILIIFLDILICSALFILMKYTEFI